MTDADEGGGGLGALQKPQNLSDAIDEWPSGTKTTIILHTRYLPISQKFVLQEQTLKRNYFPQISELITCRHKNTFFQTPMSPRNIVETRGVSIDAKMIIVVTRNLLHVMFGIRIST